MTDTWGTDQAEHRFYFRLLAAVVATILLSFAQWSARGMVDIMAAPYWVHLHGLLFVAFLMLVLVQQHLAMRQRLALHRPLGWLGLALAIGLGFLSTFLGYAAIDNARLPPGFTNALMLAVSLADSVVFAGFVIAAVVLRKHTAWHRRLILGAMVAILDPALGRLLPGELLQGWAVPAIAAIQLAVLAVAMYRDRAIRGAVHPSLWWCCAIIPTMHLSYTLLADWPPFVVFADSIAAT